MANIKSAKKRIRVIDKKTARNRRVKNHLKTCLLYTSDEAAARVGLGFVDDHGKGVHQLLV